MALPYANCQIVQLVAGAAHNMIITRDDQVYGLGYNGMAANYCHNIGERQLALGHNDTVANWQKSTALSNQQAKQIFMCNNSSHLTTRNNKLFVFGLHIDNWYPYYGSEYFVCITMFENDTIRFITHGQMEPCFALVTGMKWFMKLTL